MSLSRSQKNINYHELPNDLKVKVLEALLLQVGQSINLYQLEIYRGYVDLNEDEFVSYDLGDILNYLLGKESEKLLYDSHESSIYHHFPIKIRLKNYIRLSKKSNEEIFHYHHLKCG